MTDLRTRMLRLIAESEVKCPTCLKKVAVKGGKYAKHFKGKKLCTGTGKLARG